MHGLNLSKIYGRDYPRRLSGEAMTIYGDERKWRERFRLCKTTGAGQRRMVMKIQAPSVVRKVLGLAHADWHRTRFACHRLIVGQHDGADKAGNQVMKGSPPLLDGA